ncbi:phage tail protein [Sphingomonas hengshuiensis]|uniref:Phage tail collar domain-containing protein n=1 Tax=Sphingomonas hengshuiensis TaxID=1609977 RepID=A0A7U4LFS6_9SPHN|nr:tail fiber protein [Sphingomonas hengshuiensis]AJP72822.1 hypothetical protein TS85_15110 [Sphingomonas hengshuiensis]
MDAFIGEIRLFPYTFCPLGWAPCQGQLFAIQDYQALAAVIGNKFGGDGKSNFKLPLLSGRTAVGWGDNQTDIFDPAYATHGGSATVALSTATIPPHSHTLNAVLIPQAQRAATPAGNLLTGISYRPPTGTAPTSNPYSPAVGGETTLNINTLSPVAGASTPHENRQPALALQWCICTTEGYFPVRS